MYPGQVAVANTAIWQLTSAGLRCHLHCSVACLLHVCAAHAIAILEQAIQVQAEIDTPA